MYRTVPIRARFTDEEHLFWTDQCRHANSLTNCALYYIRQNHYARLEEKDDGFITYWKEDNLRAGWKTYKCQTAYAQVCRELKDNPHYNRMAAQSAQQTLKTVSESITSYNALVKAYYAGEVDRPILPRYRKKGGLASVTFPRQALTYFEGCFYPSVSRETKPELLTDIKLQLPDLIDSEFFEFKIPALKIQN